MRKGAKRQAYAVKQLPSQELLRSIFTYDNQTGFLLRDGKTGSPDKRGYRYISIKKKLYLAHRLIWVYLNGSIPEGMEIDHIDGQPHNNRIENLRLAGIHSPIFPLMESTVVKRLFQLGCAISAKNDTAVMKSSGGGLAAGCSGIG